MDILQLRKIHEKIVVAFVLLQGAFALRALPVKKSFLAALMSSIRVGESGLVEEGCFHEACGIANCTDKDWIDCLTVAFDASFCVSGAYGGFYQYDDPNEALHLLHTAFNRKCLLHAGYDPNK